MKIQSFLLSIVGAFLMVFSLVLAAPAAVSANVRVVSGEIVWIDTRLGKLQIKNDESKDFGRIEEFRITEHETQVTNTPDSKFFSIEDLHPGQRVKLEVENGQEQKIVKQITTDTRWTGSYLEAYGRVEAIDETGTLTLAGRQSSDMTSGNVPSYYVFDPKTILVMQSPDPDPVKLFIKPGDIVKIEYVLDNQKQKIYSVTLYSSEIVSKTTTTTTTTIEKQ